MVFTCVCKWTYLIGNGWVYGPIFEDWSYDCARIISLEDFEVGYADCHGKWEINARQTIPA